MKRKLYVFLQRMSVGITLSLAAMLALLLCNSSVLSGEICLYEVLPLYGAESTDVMVSLLTLRPPTDVPSDALPAFSAQNEITETPYPALMLPRVHYDNSVTRLEDNLPDGTVVEVVGTKSVTFQPESVYTSAAHALQTDVLTPFDIASLRDLDALRAALYTVESNTQMTAQDFNLDAFLSAGLHISNANKSAPKILIFHTHSTEFYADSDRSDMYDGIVGVGKKLAEILTNDYGIHTMHCAERFDYADGKSQITGAYERMEPIIQRILAENPSIELVIDMHRDGVPNDSIRFVTDINGKSTAKIMFVNGLTKLVEAGVLTSIPNLPNAYLPDNLALSFRMQLAANERFPSFARKIYLKAYRYSLHMLPKSLLVEVGAQTNTVAEAHNAMEPLAEVLASVILK